MQLELLAICLLFQNISNKKSIQQFFSLLHRLIWLLLKTWSTTMSNITCPGLLTSSTITSITTITTITTKDLEEIADEEDYVPYADRHETYIVPIVFAIIFVVGVIGNGTLVLIFVRERTMRNVPNTYILSLAIGDLLVIITCVPFTSTLYTIESWPYGEGICKLSECVKDISIGVSVFTLTALSAERWVWIITYLKIRHKQINCSYFKTYKMLS